MKRKTLILVTIAVSILMVSSTMVLASSGKKWNDHAAPWDFLMNDSGLDAIHEFKTVGQTNDGGYAEMIKGFMYIRYIDDVNATGGTDMVGWQVHGRFAVAEFNGMGATPPWTVDADDVPQPQGYVHWHPIDGHDGKVAGTSYPGYFLKHTAVDSFYFVPQSRWVSPGIDFDFPNNYNTTN